MVDKKLECLVYAYERTLTHAKKPVHVPSSYDIADREYGWSREDHNRAVGLDASNLVTEKTVEVRAYFPETKKDEFIVKGRGELYCKLSLCQDFNFNGKQYEIVNDFPLGFIVDPLTELPLIKTTGRVLRAGSFSEEFVIEQMKKYQRGR